MLPNNLSSILAYLDAKLTQVSRRREVVSVGYAELDSAEGAARVFEHALQLPFDFGWWETLRRVKIEESFATFERYGVAYGPQLRKMAGLAKGAMLHDLSLRERVGFEGMEFCEETLVEFLANTSEEFRHHAYLVGEPPDAWRKKNLALLAKLSDAGALQIIAARCNGRAFGYLMTELMESREAPGRAVAVETLFFASEDVPGLGMKLQRETLKRLRERSVSEVWFRDGTRGSGGRLGSMYRRLGASPAGMVWKLDLEGTM